MCVYMCVDVNVSPGVSGGRGYQIPGAGWSFRCL